MNDASQLNVTTSVYKLQRALPMGTAIVKTTFQHIQDGRFQRSLAFVTAGSSFISGLEVAYEHYKGSYSQRIMYTPVILSGVVSVAAIAAVFSRRAAETALRATSALTLLDGLIGFYFHVRGIARKPGGWRIPIVNLVMGPPVFAPLLFGTAAYLGLMASYLRREEDPAAGTDGHVELMLKKYADHNWRQDLREGRFQKHLAAIAGVWSICSGFEAWYSHYKNNFRYKAQWSPVILSTLLLFASMGAVMNRRIAVTALPAVSSLTIADGAVGFFYHARGILRRPAGRRKWLYNILYGPPIFAPLLLSACGTLGLLASLLRRER